MDPLPIHCPSCGAAVPDGTFCRDCGARLARPACPSCDHPADDLATFCTACGAALRADQRTAPPAAAPSSPMASPGQQPFPATTGVPSPTGQWVGYPVPPLPSPLTSPYPPPPPPPVPSMYLGYRPVPETGLPGRFRAAAYAIGSLLAISVIGLLCFAAAGNLMEQAPHMEGRSVIVILLTFGAFWLGGGIWMGMSAGWGWAAGFWLAWPLTMPVYIYQAVRGGHAPSKPRFPTVWVFMGFALMAALLLIGSTAFSSSPAEPRAVETESPEGTSVAAAASVATSMPTSVADEVGPDSTPRPVPTRTSDREISYDPVAIQVDLLGEAVLASESPGTDACELDAGYDDEVVQTCDEGEISYLVFDSDWEAADYVLYDRSPSAFPLEGRERYPTDILFGSSGEVSFFVAVGNIVVIGISTMDADQGDGVDLDAIERDAAHLASLGVERVERLGGEPRPAGNTL